MTLNLGFGESGKAYDTVCSILRTAFFEGSLMREEWLEKWLPEALVLAEE
ncbi:hypothetical protein [Streptomyces sp. P9-A2]